MLYFYESKNCAILFNLYAKKYNPLINKQLIIPIYPLIMIKLAYNFINGSINVNCKSNIQRRHDL